MPGTVAGGGGPAVGGGGTGGTTVGSTTTGGGLKGPSKYKHEHDLEHSLHQLLHRVYHNSFQHPLPHPVYASMGMSKRRRAAGLEGMDRNQVRRSSHAVACYRTPDMVALLLECIVKTHLFLLFLVWHPSWTGKRNYILPAYPFFLLFK